MAAEHNLARDISGSVAVEYAHMATMMSLAIVVCFLAVSMRFGVGSLDLGHLASRVAAVTSGDLEALGLGRGMQYRNCLYSAVTSEDIYRSADGVEFHCHDAVAEALFNRLNPGKKMRAAEGGVLERRFDDLGYCARESRPGSEPASFMCAIQHMRLKTLQKVVKRTSIQARTGPIFRSLVRDGYGRRDLHDGLRGGSQIDAYELTPFE